MAGTFSGQQISSLSLVELWWPLGSPLPTKKTGCRRAHLWSDRHFGEVPSGWRGEMATFLPASAKRTVCQHSNKWQYIAYRKDHFRPCRIVKMCAGLASRIFIAVRPGRSIRGTNLWGYGSWLEVWGSIWSADSNVLQARFMTRIGTNRVLKLNRMLLGGEISFSNVQTKKCDKVFKMSLRTLNVTIQGHSQSLMNTFFIEKLISFASLLPVSMNEQVVGMHMPVAVWTTCVISLRNKKLLFQ